jgi:hypothetical protein
MPPRRRSFYHGRIALRVGELSAVAQPFYLVKKKGVMCSSSSDTPKTNADAFELFENKLRIAGSAIRLRLPNSRT